MKIQFLGLRPILQPHEKHMSKQDSISVHLPEKIFFTFNFFNFPTYTTDTVTYIDAKNIDKIFNILQGIFYIFINPKKLTIHWYLSEIRSFKNRVKTRRLLIRFWLILHNLNIKICIRILSVICITNFCISIYGTLRIWCYTGVLRFCFGSFLDMVRRRGVWWKKSIFWSQISRELKDTYKWVWST